MAQWSDIKTATLKVHEAANLTNTFTFNGVAASNSAGTPNDFLSAANNILGFVGKQATITGITRTVQQEATDNG